MITPYLCALASKLAYEKEELVINQHLPTGWKFYLGSALNNNGYRGIAIHNQETSEVIIAHRGTEFEIFENLSTDYCLFNGEKPTEVDLATEFSACVRELFSTNFTIYTFVETGHSLGSIFAEFNSDHFKCKAITFDSPGSVPLFLKEKKTEPVQLNVTTYFSAPNPINTCNRHVGNLIRIYIHHVDNTGIRSTDNFKSLKQMFSLLKSLYFRPISTQKLLSNVIGLLLQRTGMDIFRYYKRQHSIDLIVNAFDPDVGYPYLQREMISWPLKGEFMYGSLASVWASDKKQFFKNALSLYATSQSLEINLKIEELLCNFADYKPGDFIIPRRLDEVQDILRKKYSHISLTMVPEFYTDNSFLIKHSEQLNYETQSAKKAKEKITLCGTIITIKDLRELFLNDLCEKLEITGWAERIEQPSWVDRMMFFRIAWKYNVMLYGTPQKLDALFSDLIERKGHIVSLNVDTTLYESHVGFKISPDPLSVKKPPIVKRNVYNDEGVFIHDFEDSAKRPLNILCFLLIVYLCYKLYTFGPKNASRELLYISAAAIGIGIIRSRNDPALRPTEEKRQPIRHYSRHLFLNNANNFIKQGQIPSPTHREEGESRNRRLFFDNGTR
jgi:hypothetical protein